jgi:thiol:disulfide interchange protein DsbD
MKDRMPAVAVSSPFVRTSGATRALRLAALLICFPTLAWAQAAVTTEHVQAELVAHAPQGIEAGKPVWLGLSIRHQPHWHTYWKNPGDSGLPTTLSWQLPASVQVSDIHWPTPQQLPIGPLMNYGYEGDLLLPVEVTVPRGFAAPVLDVKLRADWLVCKDVCIPESGEFTLSVPVAAGTNQHAGLFAAAQARIPQAVPQAVATARVDGKALAIDVKGLPEAVRDRALTFFPETGGVIEPAAPIAQRWNGSVWTANVPLSPQRSESPTTMPAVLVADGAAGLQVRIDINGGWPGSASAAPVQAAAASPATTEETSPSLVVALGLALLGGLLLNLMPCVFPVLSLKVLSFAKPGHERSAASAGLAYTAGVMVSFVALAGLLLVLRAGGEQLGWGFQLQSPLFVAALAVLFTVIGLNLVGVFDLRGVLPGNLAAVRARHPVVDHLLTGVLAVAVASPCSGPFMGVALGAALTLPAPQTLGVFAALGFGMALPYLAIGLMPRLAHALPRPGAWMQRFKVSMAFPMFATVVWLLWVLGQQVGIDGATGLLGVLVALAFAAWALGTPGFGRHARWGLGSFAAVVLVGTLAWAWPAVQAPNTATLNTQAPATARWQPWSTEALAKARAEGRPVFVDFTAAWCVTCQFNKRTALADPAVLADFDAQKVVLLRADWTRRDAAITQELGRLGRSGVPVYVLYGPGAARPVVLPEILRAAELRRAINTMQLGA